MSRHKLLLVVAAAILTSGIAGAGEIYKWTDADGNVHYGDRPIGDGVVERVAISSRNTNSAKVAERVQAHDELQTSRKEAKAKKADEAKAAADAQAEQDDRDQQCQTYRARMQKYLQTPRLYRQDGEGERVYLDDEQILAARAKVQDKIQEYCD